MNVCGCVLQENLKKLGIKKKKGKIINFLAPSLLIRHKDTKIEYTIKKVIIKDGKSSVVAFRYYNKPPNKKVYIIIKDEDLNKYGPV